MPICIYIDVWGNGVPSPIINPLSDSLSNTYLVLLSGEVDVHANERKMAFEKTIFAFLAHRHIPLILSFPEKKLTNVLDQSFHLVANTLPDQPLVRRF